MSKNTEYAVFGVAWITFCLMATLATAFITMDLSLVTWPWWGRMIMLGVWGLMGLPAAGITNRIKMNAVLENMSDAAILLEAFKSHVISLRPDCEVTSGRNKINAMKLEHIRLR